MSNFREPTRLNSSRGLRRSPSSSPPPLRSSRRSVSPPIRSSRPTPRIVRQSPSPPPTNSRYRSPSRSSSRSPQTSNRNRFNPHNNLGSARSGPQPSQRSPSPLLNGSSRRHTKSASSFVNPDITVQSVKSSINLPEQKSPYSKFMHSLREIMPQKMACKMGCKGVKCKYDNSDWPEEDMAIPGLFSHWVTDDIIAIARPRNKLIKENNLIHLMKKAGIRSIFNLQSREEHKDCGEGILPHTGYSYDPLDFSSAGIYYYNFEMEDYGTVPPMKMIDMVRVFDFALSQGKVAVHCHAGLGRTGLFIASYLIYIYRMSSNQAIFYIRDKRKGTVQMNDQINAIREFETFIKPLWVVYPHAAFTLTNEIGSFYDDPKSQQDPNSSFLGSVNSVDLNNNFFMIQNYKFGFTLHTYLIRQRLILHGYERKMLKYIPKIIFAIGEQIKKLASKWKDDGIDPYKLKQIEKVSNELQKDLHDLSMNGRKTKSYSDELNQLNPNTLIAKSLCTSSFPKKIIRKIEYYQKSINENNDAYSKLTTEDDPFVLTALLWCWIDNLKEPILRGQEVNILFEKLRKHHANAYNPYEKSLMNWHELDRGTFHTINYLAGVINVLMPLEDRIENKLIAKFISYLTQTQIYDKTKNFEEFSNDDHISLLNTTRSLDAEKSSLLHRAIKDLIDRPMSINGFEKSMSQVNLKKIDEQPQYDYAEEIMNDDYKREHRSSNRVKRSNYD